jgi:hypothetical protein
VIAGVQASAPVADGGWAVQLTVDGPLSAVRGQPYTYTVVLKNPGAPTTVWLQDRYDIINSIVPTQGTCGPVGDGTTQCNLGTVGTGATVSVAITATAADSGPRYSFLMAYPTQSGGPATEYNDFHIDIVEPGTPTETDLRATVSGPVTAERGANVVYDITLRNADSRPATGVTLAAQSTDYRVWFGEASSPSGSCGQADSGWSPMAASCKIGTIAPGQTVTMKASFCSEDGQATVGVDVDVLQDWNGQTDVLHNHLAEARTSVPAGATVYCPSDPYSSGGGGGGGGGPPTQITNVGPPQITGPVAVGATLNATTGVWSPTWPYSYSYRWYTCAPPTPENGGAACDPSPPGNHDSGAQYTVVPEDAGCTLRVAVTASDGVAHDGLVFSGHTQPVPGSQCRLAPAPPSGGGSGSGGNSGPAPVTTGGGAAGPAAPSGCAAGYSPCLPKVTNLDCSQIPNAKKPVRVTGGDPYGLDRDRDGLGCEIAGAGGGADSPYGLILRRPTNKEAMVARVGDTLRVVGWSPASASGHRYELCARRASGRTCATASTYLLRGRVQVLGLWKIHANERVAGMFKLSLVVAGVSRASDAVQLR